MFDQESAMIATSIFITRICTFMVCHAPVRRAYAYESRRMHTLVCMRMGKHRSGDVQNFAMWLKNATLIFNPNDNRAHGWKRNRTRANFSAAQLCAYVTNRSVVYRDTLKRLASRNVT